MKTTAVFYIILVFCLISLMRAAPKPTTSKEDTNLDVLSHQNVDYNVMMSHFKDFFMYLPVMFTSFKETMSGFPKLAEGIRILASPGYEKSYSYSDDDCKCKIKSVQNSNEIDKSSIGYR